MGDQWEGLMADDDEGTKKQGSERREWHRILVDLEVDYGNSDNFLFAYICDISETGIFVRTNSPEEPGTLLNLRFTPNDGQREALELEGKVIWVNSYRPGNPDNLSPGMGVRFVDLDAEHRFRLGEYIKTFAYLEDPTPSPAGEAQNDERPKPDMSAN